MNEEEDELLFLSKLYKTWPWCYDREAIIELRGKIIIRPLLYSYIL